MYRFSHLRMVIGRVNIPQAISASRPARNKIPTATVYPLFSGSRNSMDLFRKTPYVTGSQKFKMAAVKTEMLISQLLDKIATKFQRLPHIVGVQQLSGSIADNARCNRKSVIQDGGLQTW